jgi:hypothetical protein
MIRQGNNTMRSKLTVLVVSLSAVMASSAFAGDIKPLHTAFNGSLGTGVKKDILRAACPTGTSPAVTSVQASVGDKAPVNAPIVKVQIKKVSANTNCTTAVTASGAIQQDNIDGDTQIDPETGLPVAIPSAPSSVAGGNGTAFRIEVFKTEAGGAAETYSLNYHCENSTTNHPVPTLTYCQNQ